MNYNSSNVASLSAVSGLVSSCQSLQLLGTFLYVWYMTLSLEHTIMSGAFRPASLAAHHDASATPLCHCMDCSAHALTSWR